MGNSKDDYWEALFGTDDGEEVIEPDGQGDRNNSGEFAGVSSSSVPAISESDLNSSENSIVTVPSSTKQKQNSLSSFDAMSLCIKYGEKLRLDGNTQEADALSVVGIIVLNMMLRAVELYETHGAVHFGNLMMETAGMLLKHGSTEEWCNLIYCTKSIEALIDEVQQVVADKEEKTKTEEVEGSKKLGRKELACKLANERKRRKLEAACAKKQKEADEKRRCREMAENGSYKSLYFQSPTAASHHSEAFDRGENVIVMAANKFKNRQMTFEKQVVPTVNHFDESFESMSHLDSPDVQGSQYSPDVEFIGPVSAEELMEECENDSNNSVLSSSLLPVEALNTPEQVRMIIIDSEFDQSGETYSNDVAREKSQSTSSLSGAAQKYANLPFAKIRKGCLRKKGNLEKTQTENKRVTFCPENEYSVVEVSCDADVVGALRNIDYSDYCKKYRAAPSTAPEGEMEETNNDFTTYFKDYDLFLTSASTSKPVDKCSFYESCGFPHAGFRNWLIVGSRFDCVNDEVFDVKTHGCPKTRFTRANYPPIQFRAVYDALMDLKTNVAGMIIFFVACEDWAINGALKSEEFTSFIKSFAHVLYKLYIRGYEQEQKKELEFNDNSEEIERGFAYSEMPKIVLFTVPKIEDPVANARCIAFNKAVTALVRCWDFTSRSFYYHEFTKQCVEVKLVDWRQMCLDKGAVTNADMIAVLMKHLMEDWGVCLMPKKPDMDVIC